MESAVTLPGGADKLGNRYEALWAVWQWLRLLSEEAAEFRLESFEASVLRRRPCTSNPLGKRATASLPFRSP